MTPTTSPRKGRAPRGHQWELTHALIDVQFQLLLRDALLDALAERGIPGRLPASLAVIDQAAALTVKERRRGAVVAVLLRAKAVHAAAYTLAC